MQGLADEPITADLFRLELDTLEEVISITEQEDLSIRQASRSQEIVGTEHVELCYIESDRPRSSSNKR